MHVATEALLRFRIERDCARGVFSVDAGHSVADSIDVAGAGFISTRAGWTASADICNFQIPNDGEQLRFIAQWTDGDSAPRLEDDEDRVVAPSAEAG